MHDIHQCENYFCFADNGILVLFFACNFWFSQALRTQPDRLFIFEKAMYIANVYKIPVLALFYYFGMDPTDPTYLTIFILYEAGVHVIVYSGIIIIKTNFNLCMKYRNPFKKKIISVLSRQRTTIITVVSIYASAKLIAYLLKPEFEMNIV